MKQARADSKDLYVDAPGRAKQDARPRLGFAGLGWIGAQRMQVLAESGLAEIVAVCDPQQQALEKGCAPLSRKPGICQSFEELLAQPLDGVVIATPNALHEPQSIAAMEKGLAVFSQKPLALSRRGTERLLNLARTKNLPLGIDWSYRYLAGVQELKQQIASGELGAIHAVELCFHNAYGPDASWYYDLARAGGGCLLDLGCHLLDLCHWLIGASNPIDVSARCFRNGARIYPPLQEPEDFVMAEIDYASGQHMHLSCSWRAPAGRGAIIGCRIFGTGGGAEIRNVDGSFYDFEVALNRGAESTLLGAPPDAWPGRALIDWTNRLREGEGCDPEVAHVATTAEVIDRIYKREVRESKLCA
jgi:predicted dehydrogenase